MAPHKGEEIFMLTRNRCQLQMEQTEQTYGVIHQPWRVGRGCPQRAGPRFVSVRRRAEDSRALPAMTEVIIGVRRQSEAATALFLQSSTNIQLSPASLTPLKPPTQLA